MSATYIQSGRSLKITSITHIKGMHLWSSVFQYICCEILINEVFVENIQISLPTIWFLKAHGALEAEEKLNTFRWKIDNSKKKTLLLKETQIGPFMPEKQTTAYRNENWAIYSSAAYIGR